MLGLVLVLGLGLRLRLGLGLGLRLGIGLGLGLGFSPTQSLLKGELSICEQRTLADYRTQATASTKHLRVCGG